MNRGNVSRRGFLRRSLAAMAVAGLPAWYGREILAAEEDKKDKKPAANDRIVMGAIGIGSPQSRGRAIAQDALNTKKVQYVAVCDVDARHRKSAVGWMKEKGQEVKDHKDFRALLDNKDIQAVTIATPDHWHVLVAIEALRKGKDVYCEKPLTLTIAEGQALLKVVKETRRVFQVGSQQRSDGRFRLACEMVRNGRIGQVKTVETRIGGIDKNKVGPFKKEPVPEGLDWDFWQGQTGPVDYIPQRCHYEFRWWYEYSGGKMTDWGAHHNDIAQWGLGTDETGPVSVEASGFADSRPDCYNVHSEFTIHYTYANDGPRLVCTAGGENGVKFLGEDDKWIFVSRGRIEASDKKLLEEPLGSGAARLYVSNNHMDNFLDCVVSRKPTICPAEVGHRSVTVCHIGAIALRTGKRLKWDPVKERFDDDEANRMLSREMRAPWKIEV
ncbi:MAG TPA: Gfo/Idh/MocA family oxidoreductase [Gemmataceae bacterium]|nr:Gfo/Idh/MocA family oxidoreductase [Gemmataceae bacterium]